MKKNCLLALFLALAIPFAITAASDDKARPFTVEDGNLISSVMKACDIAVDKGKCTSGFSDNTYKYVFKKGTYKVCADDGSETSVTISSHGTIRIILSSNSTYAQTVYNLGATIGGNKYSVYLKAKVVLETGDVTIGKIVLDHIVLNDVDDSLKEFISDEMAAMVLKGTLGA